MNLIITCSRHLEGETSEEISMLLESLGDKNNEITITNLSGIVTCITTLDPFLVVKKIKEKILEEPWSMRYCHRIIPIQETVITEKQNIVNAILNHSKIMRSEETYRITVEKRHSSVSTKEIIDAIAEKISNKVSLEKFDWMILVEILGNKTGISVLKEKDILSTQKLKRSLSE
ncbi:MAG TPA: THUMP domain-containing protein [Nitrosopumilaceae archaeon]|nr:THUMP domain-containing protein [Nitrosopumilaceae archaeon]